MNVICRLLGHTFDEGKWFLTNERQVSSCQWFHRRTCKRCLVTHDLDFRDIDHPPEEVTKSQEAFKKAEKIVVESVRADRILIGSNAEETVHMVLETFRKHGFELVRTKK